MTSVAMRRVQFLVFALSLFCASLDDLSFGRADALTTQTIVFVRHGEKPEAGLGQLNCQGLNRALALAGVVARKFGKPTAIFAPDPAKAKADRGVVFDYVRPLATVEPTAIAFGLPVRAHIGFTDLARLARALERRELRKGVVLVGWEHKEIVKIVKLLLAAHGGDPKSVPVWNDHDFDSVYVLKIKRGASEQAAFERQNEGLDGRPASCPQ